MSSSETTVSIVYDDSKSIVTLNDKRTAAVFDASSPVALFGVISELISVDERGDQVVADMLSDAAGHPLSDDDRDTIWDERFTANLSFIGVSGTEHSVSLQAFHFDDEQMTLADAADVLITAVSVDSLAEILDGIKSSGDLDESQIEAELGGTPTGGDQ